MLAPDWLPNTHLTGAAWLCVRIGLTLLVAVTAALASPRALERLHAPLDDDGIPAADYQDLSHWRPLMPVTAVVAAAIAGTIVWTVPWPVVPAALAVAVATPLLGYVDLRAQLLPDPVTLAATVLALVAMAVGCLTTGHARALVVALMTGVAAMVGFLLLALFGGGLGFGDVKLVFVLAATAAAVSLTTAILLLVLAILFGGVTALVLVTFRLRDRKAHLPFGPFLLAGWWLALVWGGAALSAG